MIFIWTQMFIWTKDVHMNYILVYMNILVHMNILDNYLTWTSSSEWSSKSPNWVLDVEAGVSLLARVVGGWVGAGFCKINAKPQLSWNWSWSLSWAWQNCIQCVPKK